MRALKTNKTLKPCKSDDYASFFKRVTPKHSLLVRCKNETYDSETYAKNHANMTMPRSLSVNPKTFAFGTVQKRDLTPKHVRFYEQPEYRTNTGMSMPKT